MSAVTTAWLRSGMSPHFLGLSTPRILLDMGHTTEMIPEYTDNEVVAVPVIVKDMELLCLCSVSALSAEKSPAQIVAEIMKYRG